MTPRIYTDSTLADGCEVLLSRAASHHICNVLRLGVAGKLVLFNGDGSDYPSTLATTGKQATARVTGPVSNKTESALKIHLLQGISRSDRMDATVQKAVELGVSAITPMITEKSQVKLSPERSDKKMQHWQAIIIGACEQCGRSTLPTLHPPVKLLQYLDSTPRDGNQTRFVLDPLSQVPLGNVHLPHTCCHVLVGPESGLTDAELVACRDNGFSGVSLGPRILRTETAGASTLAVLQARFGDLRH